MLAGHRRQVIERTQDAHAVQGAIPCPRVWIQETNRAVQGRPRANDRSQHQFAEIAGADDEHVRLPATLEPNEAVVERRE